MKVLETLKKIFARRTPKAKLEKTKEERTTMTYRVGIENCYGSLLATMNFDNDREMYDFLKETNEKYVKTKDLVYAKVIVQVYYPQTEMKFENCICQYFMSFEKNWKGE